MYWRPRRRLDHPRLRQIRSRTRLRPARWQTEFWQKSPRSNFGRACRCRRPDCSETGTRLQCRRSQSRNIRVRGNGPPGSPHKGSSERYHSCPAPGTFSGRWRTPRRSERKAPLCPGPLLQSCSARSGQWLALPDNLASQPRKSRPHHR